MAYFEPFHQLGVGLYNGGTTHRSRKSCKRMPTGTRLGRQCLRKETGVFTLAIFLLKGLGDLQEENCSWILRVLWMVYGESAFPLYRVVGENPWSKGTNLQTLTALSSTDGTAIPGFCVDFPGFCFFFSLLPAPFLLCVEILPRVMPYTLSSQL